MNACPTCGTSLVAGPLGAGECPARGLVVPETARDAAMLQAIAEAAGNELLRLDVAAAGVTEPSRLTVRFVGGPLDGREEPIDLAAPPAPGGRYRWSGQLELRWRPE